MKLQQVAAILSGDPYHLDYTHVSLGRLENGQQMPKIEVIEALAHIYKTDVDSLLNRLPTLPQAPKDAGASELARIWEAADPTERVRIVKMVKALVEEPT